MGRGDNETWAFFEAYMSPELDVAQVERRLRRLQLPEHVYGNFQGLTELLRRELARRQAASSRG